METLTLSPQQKFILRSYYHFSKMNMDDFCVWINKESLKLESKIEYIEEIVKKLKVLHEAYIKGWFTNLEICTIIDCITEEGSTFPF